VAAADCPIKTLAISGERCKLEDQVFRRRDGSTFPITVVSQRLYEAGKFVGTVAAFQDISERKLAETRLAESEEIFRSIVTQASDGIVLVDMLTFRASMNRQRQLNWLSP
jgi:PAS domain-containing protein